MTRMNEEEALYINQLTSLSDITTSLQHFHNEYEEAKAKLSMVASDTALSHRGHRVGLQKDIREARKYIRLGGALLEEVAEIHQPPGPELAGKLKAIDQFGRVAKYLDWIKFLNEAVGFLDKRQTKESWRKCLPIYNELNCYCSLLEDTVCLNLKRLMTGECKKRYTVLVEVALKSFGTVNWKNLDDESLGCVLENVKTLFKLSKPLQHGKPNISLGMEYIFSHFVLQFKFHFMRKVKTNDIKKPEWYFTKILLWIREFKETFYNKFGCLFENENKVTLTALFIEQFCELSVVKLKTDLPRLTDGLFSHYIDEIINFHKELCDHLPLSHIKSPILELFTEDNNLNRWVQLETLSSFKFLAEVEGDSNCYEERDSGFGYSVPSMCVRILTSIKAVGERVEVFPSLSLNSLFYSLQCDLLKEYKVHLTENLKRLHYMDPKLSLVVNSIVYTTTILEEWSFAKYYIKISQFEGHPAPFSPVSEGHPAPFSPVSESYEVLLGDARTSLESSISSSVSRLLGGYFRQSWTLPRQLDTISPSCGPGLMELQQSLTFLSASLAPDLFIVVWSELAAALQLSFSNKILFKASFNLAGAQQFRSDMQAFCGIFHEYCAASYFSRFLELIEILALPLEKAVLWKGEGLRCIRSLEGLLEESGITLPSSQALKILQARTDI